MGDTAFPPDHHRNQRRHLHAADGSGGAIGPPTVLPASRTS